MVLIQGEFKVIYKDLSECMVAASDGSGTFVKVGTPYGNERTATTCLGYQVPASIGVDNSENTTLMISAFTPRRARWLHRLPGIGTILLFARDCMISDAASNIVHRKCVSLDGEPESGRIREQSMPGNPVLIILSSTKPCRTVAQRVASRANGKGVDIGLETGDPAAMDQNFPSIASGEPSLPPGSSCRDLLLATLVGWLLA
jgi:hypothetical protein